MDNIDKYNIVRSKVYNALSDVAYDLFESPFKNKEKIEREKPEWMKEETEQIKYSKLRYNCPVESILFVSRELATVSKS